MTNETTTQSIWRSLTQSSGGERFDPGRVGSLAEPTRRYLLHAIQPGTLLASSVELTMHGSFRTSPKGHWMPMSGSEIIVGGLGFLWKASMGRLLPIVGFDRYSEAEGEMSWRLGGLLRVAYARGADVSRSARGRFAAELVFLPSALLPGQNVSWKQSGENRTQAAIKIDGETSFVELVIAPDGQLRQAVVDRWSNFGSANGKWRFAPFAACFHGEERFGGYTIPTRLSAGWWGEDGWQFEFFRAEIASALFH